MPRGVLPCASPTLFNLSLQFPTSTSTLTVPTPRRVRRRNPTSTSYVDAIRVDVTCSVGVESISFNNVRFNDWGDEFWWRAPTGDEGAVQVITAWNHGIKGHCAWIASSADNDLLYNASSIATQLLAHSDFVIDAADNRRGVNTSLDYDGQNGVDIAAWTRVREEDGVEETLVLAANLFYKATEFEIEGVEGSVKEVLFGAVNKTESGGPLFIMPRTSVAGVIMEKP